MSFGRIGSRLAWVALLTASAFSGGCASAPVRAARAGDLRDLGAEIQAGIDDGSLTRGEAADIARAVAEREIEYARGKEGVARIHEVRACARDLDDALEARARTPDEVGVEAAWARALYVEPKEYEDAAARRKAMADPDARARRAAMRAALEARDPGDVPALVEAARVDPDPLVRTDAVRVLGAIGGPEVASRLRDLWTAGDDALRGDVAIAWTKPGVFPLGGEEALKVILATQHGAGAVEAAAAVLRMRGGEAAPSPELRDMAIALFVRTIQNDARRARLHALATAPIDEAGDVLAAVREAAKDDDLEIKVSALARRLEVPSDRPEALRELEAIAGRDQGRVPRRALFALAAAGHLRIQAWLEAALRSPDPAARMQALVGLIALDRGPRGAGLLADADPSVRTRAACMLIGAGHRR